MGRLLVFLGVDYSSSGRLLLKFCDLESGCPIVLEDSSGHAPYLLVRAGLRDVVPRLKELGVRYRIQYVTKVDPFDLSEVRLLKVSVDKPSHVKKIREALSNLPVYEAKIRYRYCYIFDLGLEPFGIYTLENDRLIRVPCEVRGEAKRIVVDLCGEDRQCIESAFRIVEACETPLPPLKRCAIDVEVWTPRRGTFPSPENAEYPILAVAVCGSDGYKKVYVNTDIVKDRSDIELVDDFEIVEVSEKELLEHVFNDLRRYPIVLTYNGDCFDLPYLANRAEKLGINNVPIRLGEYPTLVHGIHLDLYKFLTVRAVEEYAFDRAYKHTDKTLDNIARVLLGIGKHRPSKPISELGLGELAYYCFRDAFLTLYLTYFANELLMRLIVLLSRISYTLPEDLCRHQISFWIKNLLYAEHRRRNWLIPNKEDIAKRAPASTRGIKETSKYAGGITLEPLRGMFENVIVVDFASLYPTIIRNLNLSYETINCKCCNYRPHPDLPHVVCRRRKGLVATIVGTLRDLRVYVYKRLAKSTSDPRQRLVYDAVQRALKVFINASYGVFGAEHFDLYCPALAELVTAVGRIIFASTLVKAMELGMTPIYGDVDSIFLWNATEEAIKKLQDWCLESFGVELDIDKIYRICMFSGRKKTYIGIHVDGTVDVKGLTRSRSEPQIVHTVRDTIVDYLKKISDLSSIDDVRQSIARCLVSVYRMLRRREVPLNMLMISTTLQKNPEEYSERTVYAKVSKLLKEHGVDVRKGTTICFVKTVLKEGYMPVQLVNIADIDVDYYINRLLSRVEIILESIGITRDELKQVLANTFYTSEQ